MPYLQNLPVELLCEIFSFLPSLGDVRSFLLASPLLHNIFVENQRRICLRVLSCEIEPWNTAYYVALVQDRPVTASAYVLDKAANLTLVPPPQERPDPMTLAMNWRAVARARRGFERTLGKPSLSPGEARRFTTAFYTLWLYVLSAPALRASLVAAHAMPALLQVHDIARNLYSMQEKFALSTFFGGNEDQWKYGIESFFADWIEAVEARLDDDGYFDPRVVESPLRAIQEPLLCWALLDEWQGYVERVRWREDVRAGKIVDERPTVRENWVGKGTAGEASMA